MPVLLDTGVLLRLFERLDPNYSDVRAVLKLLWARGDEMVITPQNAVEFWNVSTRPVTARGGRATTVFGCFRSLLTCAAKDIHLR